MKEKRLQKEADRFIKGNEPVDDFLNWDNVDESSKNDDLLQFAFEKATEQINSKVNAISAEKNNICIQKPSSSKQNVPASCETSLDHPYSRRQELRQQIGSYVTSFSYQKTTQEKQQSISKNNKNTRKRKKLSKKNCSKLSCVPKLHAGLSRSYEAHTELSPNYKEFVFK